MSEISKTIEQDSRSIEWKDLVTISNKQIFIELTLPVPWLLVSLALYATPFWSLGAIPSFMFFLCALRLNHEAMHNNLSLPRWADNLILHILSVLLMASNHAVAFSHIIHHRHEMGPGDYEGKCGEMNFFQVLVYGPKFPFDLTMNALRFAPTSRRRRVKIDWCLILAFAYLALTQGPIWLKFHVAAMVFGQCMTAFFAVWITHRGASKIGAIARSQRGPIAKAAYFMFYHREHHLFPAVPVHKLPILASRLDARIEGYRDKHLPVVPLLERFEFRKFSRKKPS